MVVDTLALRQARPRGLANEADETFDSGCQHGWVEVAPAA